MRYNRKIYYSVVLLAIFVLIGCAGQNKIPTSTEKLLRTILESPNEELYHPESTAIGLGQDAPDPDEVEAAQKSAEELKSAWEKAVGECFADDMFDTFWESPERIYFLDAAGAEDMSISVEKMESVKKEDNIQHIQTTLKVTPNHAKDSEAEEFVVSWRVIYDKEQPELIQSLELTDDGGFWERIR